ncbi:hypothetical protein DPMN_055356 [Dreissena polymorpha]|uniref:Uncharacterized protein n=1 Tax=Dreissena polymorpha TaxID=45954 RepID=A0A9D4HU00_DREPO|nr:hypothetical protein DPMN_055356 [Dreissena polymorpha]
MRTTTAICGQNVNRRWITRTDRFAAIEANLHRHRCNEHGEEKAFVCIKCTTGRSRVRAPPRERSLDPPIDTKYWFKAQETDSRAFI